GQAFGGVSSNILIHIWFSRVQGRAFGICNIGNSLAGAVLPFLLMISIQYTNVKLTWILYGIIILCFVPVCLFLIVEKPSDMGLHADNLANGKKEIRSEVFIPLKTVLQYPEIYYIGFTFGFMLMSSSSVLSQLKLRFTDVGIESFTAMALMCLTAFFCAIAKYLWGWLCDKICPVLVTRILVLFHIGALFLLFIPANLAVILIFTVCFGLAAGGSWAVMPSITAYLFGKERFICTYRAVSPFVILKALGFLIVGFSYSFFGSYDAAYLIFIVILSCCFLLTLLLKPLTTQNTLTVA
ncbi:MAG: MFS transporter, partial [Mailhella sp.]